NALLDRARDEQRFLKKYAECLLVAQPSRFPGNWVSLVNETLKLEQTESRLNATWIVGKTKKTLTGKVISGAARISVKMADDSPYPSFSLLLTPAEQKGYAYISGDGSLMFWLL